MKVLLFDIDGTLIRGGGAGRKALNRAAFELYGVKNACSELSLAGRTDLYNFGATYQNATGKKPDARSVERLHQEYLKFLPYYVKSALRTRTYHIPPGLKALLKRLSRDKRICCEMPILEDHRRHCSAQFSCYCVQIMLVPVKVLIRKGLGFCGRSFFSCARCTIAISKTFTFRRLCDAELRK